ncbi:MAG: hypothetical protein ACFFB3_24430, partial [Candidatus Hodarchaeota archaeon]
LLCELIPKAVPIKTPSYVPEKEIKVIFPFKYFKKSDSLPHSWDATSDTIAAFLGRNLSINHLLKLTAGPKNQEFALDPFSRSFQNKSKIKWTIISTQEYDFINRLKKYLNKDTIII